MNNIKNVMKMNKNEETESLMIGNVSGRWRSWPGH
jgi:hypothetical protein